MKAVIPIRTIIVIVIVLAVVLLGIAIAMGALGPVEELLSEQSIKNVLKIFGIAEG